MTNVLAQAFPDPNALYSSIIQSTAAIVAIIGGFITSTVLRRITEQETLAAQINDAESRLAALKTERQRLDDEKKRINLDFQVHKSLPSILELEKFPSFEEAKSLMPLHTLDVDDDTLRDYWSEFVRRHFVTYRAVEDIIPINIRTRHIFTLSGDIQRDIVRSQTITPRRLSP